MAPPTEDLSVTARHDIYPGIDPNQHYKDQTYKGKVVFVTGASRSIGQETALQYARAGASLVLVARKQATIDEVQNAIKKELPGAPVLAVAADVASVKQVEAAVKAAVDTFGRIDIVIANAGIGDSFGTRFVEKDPDLWWRQMEVNVRGTYNTVHFTVPYLVKSQGYIVILSSMVAQHRFLGASAYSISKHALNRLAEFVILEYPEIKTFAFHPGAIATEGALAAGFPAEMMTETIELPASTILRLTSGKDDYLSGRYVAATWDLDEVAELWKDKIVESDSLKNRLAIPQ